MCQSSWSPWHVRVACFRLCDRFRVGNVVGFQHTVSLWNCARYYLQCFLGNRPTGTCLQVLPLMCYLAPVSFNCRSANVGHKPRKFGDDLSAFTIAEQSAVKFIPRISLFIRSTRLCRTLCNLCCNSDYLPALDNFTSVTETVPYFISALR